MQSLEAVSANLFQLRERKDIFNHLLSLPRCSRTNFINFSHYRTVAEHLFIMGFRYQKTFFIPFYHQTPMAVAAQSKA
jgi:hypothetical protein